MDDVAEDQNPVQVSSDEHEIKQFGKLDDSGGNEVQKQSVDDENIRDSLEGKLFVGGIAWETSQESFVDYFSGFGELVDSIIMMDKVTGRPRGFGFVTYADPAVADKVLEKEHVIDGRSVEVKRTVPRDSNGMRLQVQGGKSKKIFVGGLPLSLTEDDLGEYFSSYGNVLENQIMLDHTTGRSRGFAFVTFESEETVEKIFSDGQLHELGGKQVEIKRAEPKRSGSDYGSDTRMRHGGGGGSKSYGGSYGSGKTSRGGYGGGGAQGNYGGYDEYAGYGSYNVAAAAAAAAGFYGAYGGGYGYGYGYGYGGSMYGGSYGMPNSYYGGKGYGTGGSGGGSGGKGYGGNSGGGYDEGKGYGGYDGENGGGRYHPYRK